MRPKVKCLKCQDHLIEEAGVALAIEIGRKWYDGDTTPCLTIWKWIDIHGHYGYGPEPNAANKQQMTVAQ